MSTISKKETLFLHAKEQYYLGNEIMTDAEFDELEDELKKINSPVTNIVGFIDRNLKFPHPSKMLSLAKQQAPKIANEIDHAAFIKSVEYWMISKIIGNQTHFEFTPKYDGNAINIIYKNGKLHLILSRGTGTHGRDYTPKLRKHVPLTVPFNDTIEIRGEVVIPMNTFNSKYAKTAKNARNYVAGILNLDNNDSRILDGTVTEELALMCYEIKHTEGKTSEYISTTRLNELGFNLKYPLKSYYYNYTDFEIAYNKMKEYRETTSPFLLDGIVIKVTEKLRASFGENSHDVNWAIAIKFPPKDARTVIKDIQWNYGKTGVLTPIAIMDPVDLDGSTVTRASIYNYGYIIEKMVYPGAKVSIAKSGDIIPQIINVNTPGDANSYQFPKVCKYCGSKLEVLNNKHLACVNEDCDHTKYKLFEEGINLLGLFGIGGSVISEIWKAGFKNAIDIFDKQKFNENILIASGFFQRGKTLENLLSEVDKIKELHLQTIIRLIGFKGMGSTTSKQISLMIAGEDYSFVGLEKSVVADFGKNEKNRIILEEGINRISKFVTIKFPESVKGKIKVEFTGSPKGAGFKTKDDFLKFIKDNEIIHSKLNEADYLITDDINSNSSKMQIASKKGIKIVTYEQFANLI